MTYVVVIVREDGSGPSRDATLGQLDGGRSPRRSLGRQCDGERIAAQHTIVSV